MSSEIDENWGRKIINDLKRTYDQIETGKLNI